MNQQRSQSQRKLKKKWNNIENFENLVEDMKKCI